MKDELVVYVDRLVGGKIEEIACTVDANFIDVLENDCQFIDPVKIQGSFYLTDDHLVGNLKIETFLQMPCSVCDEKFAFPIVIEDYYITEPLENIPSGLYYPHDGIREAILLEAPGFCECNNGNCPNRLAIANYMRPNKEELKDQKKDAQSYLPFKDLE